MKHLLLLLCFFIVAVEAANRSGNEVAEEQELSRD